MRIAFIDRYYTDFLKTITLGNQSYEEELAKILARQFGTADFYSREFKKLGWWTMDIIANDGDLQSRWGRRRGHLGPPEEMVWHQVRDYKPEVLFIQDLSLFSAEELKRLRENHLLVAQCSCALPDSERVRQFHTIFTSFPHYVFKLKALGVNAVYMPLAFHESVLKPEVERDIDVSFVGGIGWQWKQGLEVLEAVASEIPTFQWWGYGVEHLKAESPLRRCYKGTAWGSEMYAIYQRSKIVINRHGEIAANYANNMRMYEASGCGAILLTEEKQNMLDLFEGRIITYVSPEDAVASIRKLFANPHAKDFGRIGQEYTLQHHTYAHRVPKIAEVLTNAMSHA